MMFTGSPSAVEAKTGIAYLTLHNIAATVFHAGFFALRIYACQTTLRCLLIVKDTIGLSVILFMADEAEVLIAISTRKVPEFRWDYIVYSGTIHCWTEEHVLVEDQ